MRRPVNGPRRRGGTWLIPPDRSGGARWRGPGGRRPPGCILDLMARLIAVVVMLAAATTVAGAEGRDGKCWHLAVLAGSNNGQEWLNKEDANGYELVAIAPSGVNPTVTYLTRSTHPGDCQTPDAAQRRAEQEQQAIRSNETIRKGSSSETIRSNETTRTCCRYCTKGKPCGDSCIARNKTCRKGSGCAC